MSQPRRILIWLLLAAMAAMVSYIGFRGYLNPDFLINFSNSFYC
ncbi:MAG: hypothetical protein AABZ67_16320 [Pseudomonadota bacterium]